MRGSWSLKDVVPAVFPELSYEGLASQGGTDAQLAHEEATDPGTSPERREEIREQLLEYCDRDTSVMVELVRHFQNV